MSAPYGNDPEFNGPVPKPRLARRFTLIELLVCLAIIVVLIAMMLPANRINRPGRRAQCNNNLNQIALALQAYQQAQGALPPAYTVDAQGRPLHSWRTLILPYLDQESLYRTIDLSKPWNDPANAEARKESIGLYHCPEAAGLRNATTYLAIVGENACFLPNESRRLQEIRDAHGSTLMVIEADDEHAVHWMAPLDADESLVMSLGPKTELHHQGVMNAAFVDGSARFLKANTPADARRAFISIAGNDDKLTVEW